jgi:hypothetical protein
LGADRDELLIGQILDPDVFETPASLQILRASEGPMP